MLVRATITDAAPSFHSLASMLLPAVRSGIAVGLHREARAARRARIRRFLDTLDGLKALDAQVPGLSLLEPGKANDALRAIRFSLRQLDTDADELRAALVAARAACWVALHR